MIFRFPIRERQGWREGGHFFAACLPAGPFSTLLSLQNARCSFLGECEVAKEGGKKNDLLLLHAAKLKKCSTLRTVYLRIHAENRGKKVYVLYAHHSTLKRIHLHFKRFFFSLKSEMLFHDIEILSFLYFNNSYRRYIVLYLIQGSGLHVLLLLRHDHPQLSSIVVVVAAAAVVVVGQRLSCAGSLKCSPG